MVRRSTIFVVIVFVVLLAFTLLYQKYKKPADANATPTATSSVQNLFSFTATDVTTFDISNSSGRSVSFSRDANNAWVLAGQTASSTISMTVQSAVSSIANLTSTAKMEPNISPEQIGLLTPSKIITLQTVEGKKYTLRIGDITAIGNGYYVRIDDDAPVVVEKYSLDTILALLENPPIVPTPTVAVTATVAETQTITPSIVPEITLTPTP